MEGLRWSDYASSIAQTLASIVQHRPPGIARFEIEPSLESSVTTGEVRCNGERSGYKSQHVPVETNRSLQHAAQS